MKIHIRQVDDWIAVYKDGEKVVENHSLPLTFVLKNLGIEFTSDYFDSPEDYDEVTVQFPDGSDVFPDKL